MPAWPLIARLLALLGLGWLAACSMPQDIDNTLEQVRRDHVLRVGFATAGSAPSPLAGRLIARLSQVTGARVEMRRGGLEPLLVALEDGGLDLAIGEIAQDSPWQAEVAVIEPLATRREGKRQLGLSAIARNGENRWIMLIERETRNLKASNDKKRG